MEGKIKTLLTEISGVKEIEPNQPLVDSGVVVSIHFIELILSLEKAFDIQIRTFDAVPEQFLTINTIAAFVREKDSKKDEGDPLHFHPEVLNRRTGTEREVGDITEQLLQAKHLKLTGDGKVVLDGFLTRLQERFDGFFQDMAAHFDATAQVHPAEISLDVLTRAGYLRSFPKLLKYCPGEPPQAALVPAACLPCYSQYSGMDLQDSFCLTTANTVSRQEQEGYLGLERLAEFKMREILFFGSEQEIENNINVILERIRNLAEELDLTYQISTANDSFVAPEDSSKKAYQLAARDKLELQAYLPDKKKYLAIASINKHHQHFSKAFNIKHKGLTAQTACVGFGLERWCLAFLAQHGLDVSRWPQKMKQ